MNRGAITRWMPTTPVTMGLLTLLALGGAACGAVSGTNSGEIMFDFGADEDPDAGVDSGRHPLPLDAGPAPR